MNNRNHPNDTDDVEARIRADERARVEHELQTLDQDGREDLPPPPPPTDAERRLVEERRLQDGRDDSWQEPTRRTDEITDEQRVLVADPDHVVVAADEPIEVVRTRAFSVGQLLTLLAGAALVVLGVVALLDTGVDSPLNEQTGEVLGWSHTATLGIAEIVAGGLLVLFALRPGGRWLAAIVGLVLIVGGVMILGEADVAVDELGAEQSFAWVPIVAGVVAVLGALLTPRRHQRMTGVPVVH
jgi:hypothetical protein